MLDSTSSGAIALAGDFISAIFGAVAPALFDRFRSQPS
jgi:hypothetical protein